METIKKYYLQTAMVKKIFIDLLPSKNIKTVSFLVRWLMEKKKKEFYIISMVNASKVNSKMTKNIMVYKLIKKNCILALLKKD